MTPKDKSRILHKRGRGAQINPQNPFFKHEYKIDPEYLEYCHLEEELPESRRTKYTEVFPKTIINKVDSPDLGFSWSINPYQGCEHGCTYCYARNSHEYWGFSAGTDFEQQILVKKSAPELLLKALSKKSWTPETIVLSGNTDCYQPAEREFEITRKILEIFNEFNHPVSIITKNSLILRDLDLLKSLSDKNLLRVTLSITTLNETLRRAMEPRTSSISNRLKAVELLSAAGIPVNVNFAPIIPGLNSHEIFDLAEAAASRGAVSASYILVRLNGRIAELFEDWVQKEFKESSAKVLSQIKATHGGSLNENRWKVRMIGEGKYAEQIARIFKLAIKKNGLNKFEFEPLCTDRFIRPNGNQLNLF